MNIFQFTFWTSSFVIFLTIFRVANLISRGYLVPLTFLKLIILLFFRNRILSSVFQSIINENYVTFNLEEESARNLRIMTFRNNSEFYENINLDEVDNVINQIDQINKN